MTAAIWPSAQSAQSHTRQTARYPLVWDPTDHLLSRFAFGPDASSRAFVRSYGPDAWFAHQITLGRTRGGYSASTAVSAAGPLLHMTPPQVRTWLKSRGQEYGWTAMDQLTRVTLGLQAWSPAQLYETVVDFFANHLNVTNHGNDLYDNRHTMDRDVVRRYAFGNYTDMLLASARNPSMLIFLNLAESDKTLINENYGRELLELHTVGLGYTESDVKNSARLLTGRTLTESNTYVYKADRHWTGPIQVLGFRHPNYSPQDGQAGGDAYLRYLAAHPKTAAHLARKLCMRFVSDHPSPELVAAVAQAYSTHRTEIVPMLTTIFHSEEFWSSRGLKVRRPNENLLATIRILGNRPKNMNKALESLHWMSSSVGHTPLEWGAPNGYPDVADAWRSSGTLLKLWEYHRGFVQNWWDDSFAHLELGRLLGGASAATSGQALAALTRYLTGTTFDQAHLAALQTFLGERADTPILDSKLADAIHHVIPLVLDAPHHALR